MDDPAEWHSDAAPIKPQRLMRDLPTLLPAGTRYITDGTSAKGWALHYLHIPDRRVAERRAASGGLQSAPAAAQYTSEEFIAKLASLPLLHQPGTVWDYGFSTDVLGLVVEKVSGQPLGGFLKQPDWSEPRWNSAAWAGPSAIHWGPLAPAATRRWCA